jgi:hypothetical protein
MIPDQASPTTRFLGGQDDPLLQNRRKDPLPQALNAGRVSGQTRHLYQCHGIFQRK